MAETIPITSKTHKPLSILYVVTGLFRGGAELMLYRLLSRLDRTRFTPQVVSLLDHGPVSREIQALGIHVRSLGMKQGIPNLAVVLRLVRWLRQDPPDMMQTWMYHADLVGGLAARLVGNIPVAWGIRNSNLSPETSSRLTHLTVKTCAILSRWLPDRIVCCSEAVREIHAATGYVAKKMMVIPNGYELDTFRPDSEARASVRKKLGVSDDTAVVGMIARFDPQKDHRTFIRAAQLLHHNRPDVHFLLCGNGVTWENQELVRWIDEAGWQTLRPAFFGRLPAPVGTFVAGHFRRRVRRMLKLQGLGRHRPDEIYAMGRADLEAVADFLGDRPFLLGEQLTSIDAVAYAFLANVIYLPFETELKRAALGFPTLVTYCEAMEQGLQLGG